MGIGDWGLGIGDILSIIKLGKPFNILVSIFIVLSSKSPNYTTTT